MEHITAHKKVLSGSLAGLIIASLAIQAIVFPLQIKASAFQDVVVRYDRMKASTATNVRVLIKPNTVATEASIQVTFPSGFTVSASPTVNTTGVTTDSATALPGTLSVAGAGQVVTISGVTDLTVGTLYGVNIATGITTHATPGAYDVTVTTRTSAPATIDTESVTTRVISDDQVVVTASVGSTFTFALSANSAALGALDSGSVSASPAVTATITTNAASGWFIWARSANDNGSGRGALNSTANGSKIASSAAPGTASATLSAGTEGYGLGVTVSHNAGTGTPTANAAYDGASNKVGTLDPTGFRPIASSTGTATGSGDVASMVFRAAISSSTPPATDYSDTVTVVGAGSF